MADPELTLDSGWICEMHKGCTCGTGGEHGQHESGCGLVPIVRMIDVLEPAEDIALTLAMTQMRRGEYPSPNVGAACVIALARIVGKETEDEDRNVAVSEHLPARPGEQ